MSFTYFSVVTLDRDKVRLRIGDTVEDAGPRPDKRNFSDEELTFILSEEPTVNAAIAHCFEILAAEWSAWALSEREGETSIDAKEVANQYRKQATAWRSKPGGTATAERAGAWVTLTRSDAYTDSGSEYS